jgi:single-strand DNA-binding protein
MNRRYKTENGEDRDETTFIDCESYGKQAELISKYMTKGRPLMVDGRLKLDTWEKNGEKRSRIKVVVENFQFMGSRDDASNSTESGDYNSVSPTARKSGEDSAPGDDEVPF